MQTARPSTSTWRSAPAGSSPAGPTACQAATLIGQPWLADERGGVWGTGRFPTFSRRRGLVGETWFPPRTRAEGERWSPIRLDAEERRAILDDRSVLGAHLDDLPGDARGDGVHHLHHLD